MINSHMGKKNKLATKNAYTFYIFNEIFDNFINFKCVC